MRSPHLELQLRRFAVIPGGGWRPLHRAHTTTVSIMNGFYLPKWMYLVCLVILGGSAIIGFVLDGRGFALNLVSSLAAFSTLVLIGAPLLGLAAAHRAKRELQSLSDFGGALDIAAMALRSALFGEADATLEARALPFGEVDLELMVAAVEDVASVLAVLPGIPTTDHNPEAREFWQHCREVRVRIGDHMMQASRCSDEDHEYCISSARLLLPHVSRLGQEGINLLRVWIHEPSWLDKRRAIRRRRGLTPTVAWWISQQDSGPAPDAVSSQPVGLVPPAAEATDATEDLRTQRRG